MVHNMYKKKKLSNENFFFNYFVDGINLILPCAICVVQNFDISVVIEVID